MSRYGEWRLVEGLPVFDYTADHSVMPEAEWDPQIGSPTRQHWSVVGNTAISLWHANDGTVAVWDESDSLRWITAPDPEGTGISRITVDGQPGWGTAFEERPGGSVPVRTFGPTWFTVVATGSGVQVVRTVLCPEGDVPWVLVKVVLRAADGVSHQVRHDDVWRVRPRSALPGTDAAGRRAIAEGVVSYDTTTGPGAVRAMELRSVDVPDVIDREALALTADAFGGGAWGMQRPKEALELMGVPRRLVLESLGPVQGTAGCDDAPHPTLSIRTTMTVSPDRDVVLWARFGRDEVPPAVPPEEVLAESLAALAARLPSASAPVPEAREIPWHAALLTGAAAKDEVYGGHSLDQGSAYSFVIGVDAATRDALQHALPLVYSEPDLALSVLRHCVARATPAGDLPYGLDAGKRPWTELFQPSDQNVFALWLAAEHLAATGNVEAYQAKVPYRPAHGADAVSLTEHLCRQFRYFVDEIGLGERGHVRMRNADWNDGVVVESGVDRELMVAKGESVLNSAFAAWVLPVWAGAAQRLGRPDIAAEARAYAEGLRDAVRESWNGRWFQRAYAPGAPPVGDLECWMEPQSWAILCGAADEDQAHQLLDTIDRLARAGSPLGARGRFGPRGEVPPTAESSVQLAVNGPLVWAAARAGADWAWDEWQRMSLARHTEVYPSIWEGVLSGPDAWLGPEASRPGRTWAATDAGIAMQTFPVANAHAHAQPLLAYLRLLGVEPGDDGALRTGGGASFRSRTFALEEDGHGQLHGAGEVRVRSMHGTAKGSPSVTW
jgi:hypothetical protein